MNKNYGMPKEKINSLLILLFFFFPLKGMLKKVYHATNLVITS